MSRSSRFGSQTRSSGRRQRCGARSVALATSAVGFGLSALLGVSATVAGATTGGGIVPDTPRPSVEPGECPSGSLLYVYSGAPLRDTNQTIQTGVSVPTGTLVIDRFYSWDGYEGRQNVVQANEQWAVRVGSVTSALTPDLPDGLASVLFTGSLGSMSVSAGDMVLVHSSLVGLTDGSPNSVHPAALCYRVIPPETTVPTSVSSTVVTTSVTTSVTTVATTAPETTAPETTSPETTSPETTAPSTVSSTVASTKPTSVATTVNLTPAPPTLPEPVTTRPVTTAPVPAPVVTTQLATTQAPASPVQTPTTAAPTAATTVAPVAVVQGEVVEAPIAEEPLSLTGSTSRETVFAGSLMVLFGGAFVMFARRRPQSDR
jgi:hypothetical protein